MKWMKLCVLAAAAGGLLTMLVASATGQDAPPVGEARDMGVAVCDLNEVYGNYNRAADLNTEQQKRRERISAEAAKRAEAENELSKELQQWKRGTDAYERGFRELEEMRARNDAWHKVESSRLERWHVQMTKEMYEDIQRSVAKVAERRGVGVVLHMDHGELRGSLLPEVFREMSLRTVVYGAPQIDITEAVLTQVNEDYEASRR